MAACVSGCGVCTGCHAACYSHAAWHPVHKPQPETHAATTLYYTYNDVFLMIHHHNHKKSRVGPFGPFRLQSYSCSRQRFFGLPIVLFPCGLYWYDFKGIRLCGILCRCKSQFLLYSSILSGMHSVCSSRRMESLVLWSLKVWPARGLNNFILREHTLSLAKVTLL